MKSKMNDSSCSTDNNQMVKNGIRNSTIDSIGNHGDLRETKNQGDLRDVTDRGGSKERMNMTNSDY